MEFEFHSEEVAPSLTKQRSLSLKNFLTTIPSVGAGYDLRQLVGYLKLARKEGWPVVLGVGAHIVKTGLTRSFIELMREVRPSAVCMPGSTMIHDFELAMFGKTSQNVEQALKRKQYGNQQTTLVLNYLTELSFREHHDGLGETVGRALRAAPAGPSILAAAIKLHAVPTVHVAVGTDTLHMDQGLSGAALGAGTLKDFRQLTARIALMQNGGVFVCFGSAVVLPEVFLKAVACARERSNLSLDNLYTAVFDFNRHYRPEQNIVNRPSRWGAYFVGCHEFTLPLLVAALKVW